jgi:hypothetical protein
LEINIKKRITVNGKEYGSPEEMPEEIRRVYEQAMSKKSMMGHRAAPWEAKFSITFNGRKYGGVEEMPSDTRELYEGVMKTVEAGQGPTGAPAESGAGAITSERLTRFDRHESPSLAHPTGPEEGSPLVRKIMTAGVLALGLIFLIYLLGRLAGSN